jgi:hypothetical protein
MILPILDVHILETFLKSEMMDEHTLNFIQFKFDPKITNNQDISNINIA